MLRAFTNAGLMFIRKPAIILPAIFVGILNLIVLFFAWDNIEGFLYELLVLGKAPGGGFFDIPFQIFLYYPVDIIICGIAFFAIAILQFYLLFVLTEIVKPKGSGVLIAMGKGVKRIDDAIVLTLFVLVAGFLAVLVLYIIIGILMAFGELGLLLLFLAGLLYFLLLAFIMLKLSFLPFVMGVKGIKLKPALKEVWKWSTGINRLASILVILLVVAFIGSIINSIGISIGDLIPGEFFGFIPIYFFMLISLAYSILVPSIYYSSTQ
ncbi:MAG: hypothetical protein ABID38_01545 [Candidatus Diapherotrites archaeon]